MSFVTNHDENSWNGTIAERMGDNADAMTVLAGTLIGMPLIYSGQEAGIDKRLRFFEKDTVEWGHYSRTAFYQTINRLNHEQEVLWNGAAGAFPVEIETEFPEVVFAFSRTSEDATSQIITAINLSEQPLTISLPLDPATHQPEMGSEGADLAPAGAITLPEHGFGVWSKK
jgi:1,4-alpha-glucan branching enzyme